MIVSDNGVPRTCSPEVALQLKVYQDAIAGKVGATRIVLQWIAARDLERAKVSGAHRKRIIEQEHPPSNSIEEALRILNIAQQEGERLNEYGGLFLRLESWAVNAAVERTKSLEMSRADLLELQEHTRDPDHVCWPDSYR